MYHDNNSLHAGVYSGPLAEEAAQKPALPHVL